MIPVAELAGHDFPGQKLFQNFSGPDRRSRTPAWADVVHPRVPGPMPTGAKLSADRRLEVRSSRLLDGSPRLWIVTSACPISPLDLSRSTPRQSWARAEKALRSRRGSMNSDRHGPT